MCAQARGGRDVGSTAIENTGGGYRYPEAQGWFGEGVRGWFGGVLARELPGEYIRLDVLSFAARVSLVVVSSSSLL